MNEPNRRTTTPRTNAPTAGVDANAAPLLAPLAMVGIVSGVLAVRSGDLSRSILLHAGFNLLSAVLLFSS